MQKMRTLSSPWPFWFKISGLSFLAIEVSSCHSTMAGLEEAIADMTLAELGIENLQPATNAVRLGVAEMSDEEGSLARRTVARATLERPQLDEVVEQDIFAPGAWAHNRCSECLARMATFDCPGCTGHLRAHCQHCGYTCMSCKAAYCRNHAPTNQHACPAMRWVPGSEGHQNLPGVALQCETCWADSSTPTCPAPRCRMSICFECQNLWQRTCQCTDRPKWFPQLPAGAA